MDIRKRLIAGFGAAALGPLITALIQLISVPAFLHAWGARTYGEWLVMAAIPTYLSMTDMGFGSVAGNDMAMRVAVSDRTGALDTFQSTWLFVTAISLLAGAAAFTIIFLVPITSWLHITSVPPHEARLTLMTLSIYSLLSLQTSILQSAFRSDGQYALGMASINSMRLLENACMLTVLLWDAHPVHVALAGASTRMAGTALLYVILTRKLRWIRLGFASASWGRLKQLARPAIAFMAFPIGNALSLQGVTILLGVVLGPIAVATFNPMRTLSRFAYQILGQIKDAVWPELSTAYGAQDWPLARKLHRACCQLAFWLAIVAIVALAVIGPTFFRFWTHNRVTMDLPCFYILLMVVVASSLWNTSSAVPIAANRHERLAVQYIVGTAGSLVLAYLLMPHLGMAGAALALFASDAWMGYFVIPGSNRLLKDDTSDFIRSMFSLNRFKLILAR